MINVTVLDYTNGSVWQLAIHRNELSEEDFESEGEAIEHWLAENRFFTNNIEWMSHEDTNIYTNEDL
jgi:hypothetical protein